MTKPWKKANNNYRPRNLNHSTKFHRIVEQAKARYPYKNLIIERYIYVVSEISRPTKDQQIEIDKLLQEMAEKNSTLGIDSTPEERFEVKKYCKIRMMRIKLINPLYYSTLICQDE